MVACWYIANDLACVHPTCNFSHNRYDIERFQKYNMLDMWCEYGRRCPYKCNKKHKYVFENSRKRQREEVLENTLETEVRELKRQLFEKDTIINEFKHDIETDKKVVMLSHQVSRKNQEIRAIKEHHKEILKKEYLNSNYAFVKDVNKRFYNSFKQLRVDFYNNRDDHDKLINSIEDYITDISNNNGYQSLRMF